MMETDYRKSHLHPEKGKSYHSTFSENAYRNMVWQQEQAVIEGILQSFFKTRQIEHLDFACGTGRILTLLDDRTKHSVGVDLSPSMLKIARENNENAEIIEEDLTKKDVLGNKKFNLITAFRFFPNAQPELRKEAMKVLCKHLDDEGYIVFNNHKNVDSTFNRLLKLSGREGYKGMSISEVKNLTSEFGLEIVEVHHLSVFPASESKLLLPIFLLRIIETVLNKLSFLQKFGRNLIFVCRAKGD